MGGETEDSVSGWTVDTLRILKAHDLASAAALVAEQAAHLNTKIAYERQIVDEREVRYRERWQAQETASRRFQEVSNEFRGSLNDLSSKMATKDELAVALQNTNDKIDRLTKDYGDLRSRLDVGNPAVHELQGQYKFQQGTARGSEVTKAELYRTVGALTGVMTVVISLIVLLANYAFK